MGQPTDSLSSLRDSLGESTLRALARDRTARLYSGTLGGLHRLTPDLQLSADVSVSSLDGTPESGGVPGTDGSGLDIGGSLQAVITRLLSRSDVHTLGLRIFDGEFVTTTRASVGSRQPLTRGLRINPRVALTHRDQQSGTPDSVRLEPELFVDYAWRALRVDAGVGVEWTRFLEGPDGDALAILAELVVRIDF